MTKLSLTINEPKTSPQNARQERFDFHQLQAGAEFRHRRMTTPSGARPGRLRAQVPSGSKATRLCFCSFGSPALVASITAELEPIDGMLLDILAAIIRKYHEHCRRVC